MENNLEKDWDEDVLEDTSSQGIESIVVYSRDWTVETIFSQIDNGNIDLNPNFQRRNVWDDDKRSKLIESLILGLPVPEIVLAEHPEKKRSFIVIDGKQRLLSIAGFIDKELNYWEKSVLRGLPIRQELNGLSYKELKEVPTYDNEYRKLLNSDIRCTVIADYKTEDVLYNIFYRLNTSSVPLSTQELRQVLHKGKFADYLIEITNTTQPIHGILGLTGPDKRLRDVEIVLRFIAITLFGDTYNGNLKVFLDKSMETVTRQWESYEKQVTKVYSRLNDAIEFLNDVFDNDQVGRKYVDGQWERRFNKVLFEVEAYYFMHLEKDRLTKRTKQAFLSGFMELCDKNEAFRSSIESTTKTNVKYETRFTLFRDLVNRAFKTKIKEVPVKVQPA
jgi:hypothetical protein